MMSINTELMSNYEILQDKIVAYMELTKQYGKPSDDALEFFWETFGDYIKNNKFNIKNVNKDILDEEWVCIAKRDTDTEFNGGYQFFAKVYSEQTSINTLDDMRRFSNSYKFRLPITSDFEDILKNLRELEFSISDLYIYINEKMKQNVAIYYDTYWDEDDIIIIKNNGTIDNIKDADMVSRLDNINFVRKYMGVELNDFGYFPKTQDDKDALTVLLLEKGIIKDNASVVKEADHAKESDAAKKSDETEVAKMAGGLTKEASNELFNKFMEVLMEEESQVMSSLAKKTYEIQREQEYKKKHTYNFSDYYSGKITTVDIYNDLLLKKANDILSRSGRLLIIGETGSGKSELAYKLISEITGEPIGIPNGAGDGENYNRICIANARNGYSFWYEDDSNTTIGKLRLFVEHIRKNNITEPCVFVGNEIQSSDFGYLLGDALFEAFNNPCRVGEQLLPSNLYLIFIGCNNRNFGIDDQVYGRLEHVKLEYLSDGNSEGEVVADKIINNIGGDNTERSAVIVNLVSRINHNEKIANFAPVISTRELVKKLKGQRTALVTSAEDKENLTPESKKLLDKLERL